MILDCSLHTILSADTVQHCQNKEDSIMAKIKQNAEQSIKDDFILILSNMEDTIAMQEESSKRNQETKVQKNE